MVLSYISICTSLLLFWFDYIKHLFVLYLFYVKFRRVITPITMTLYVCSRVTRREYQIPSLVLKTPITEKTLRTLFSYKERRGKAPHPPPPPASPPVQVLFFARQNKANSGCMLQCAHFLFFKVYITCVLSSIRTHRLDVGTMLKC